MVENVTKERLSCKAVLMEELEFIGWIPANANFQSCGISSAFVELYVGDAEPETWDERKTKVQEVQIFGLTSIRCVRSPTICGCVQSGFRRVEVDSYLRTCCGVPLVEVYTLAVTN